MDCIFSIFKGKRGQRPKAFDLSTQKLFHYNFLNIDMSVNYQLYQVDTILVG